jgi:predicted AAA+ superfamily ATPase
MYRLVYEKLLEWKDSEERKPLILEGVRQCGKTYILLEFGKRNYNNIVHLNFEKDSKLEDIFKEDLNTERILEQLRLYFKKIIEPGKTLIIFDEIQACSEAITSLKYFCEDAPEYHVVCAGSLLGILMSKPHSYPVGKVDTMQMWPMNFKEFLLANGEDMLVEKMDALVPTDDFIRPLSGKLEHYLNMFLNIGGMPAAVSSWLKYGDINKVDRILDLVIRDYMKDFSKHAVEQTQKLTLIWKSVPEQLMRENKKFIFGHVKAEARAKGLEDALEWLVNAGLLYRVRLTSSSRFPAEMFVDNSSFKLYAVDVGIFRRMMKKKSFFAFSETEGLDNLFRGAIVESYVLNELVSADGEVPYYWRSNGKAEVDFVIVHDEHPIPIEVKAGRSLASKSLSEYINKYEPKAAIITSLEIGEGDIVKKVPLYWLWRYRAAIPGTEGYKLVP